MKDSISGSAGGSNDGQDIPFLVPPADVIVRHLGGPPTGWHIRKFLLHDGDWEYRQKSLPL
eukprot:6683335-Prorocentrum_lima.AAC.1